MCGIAGIINLHNERVNESILKLMTDAIAHRGPDGDGFWIHENIGIGHRRLAIIDLSSLGNQPMVSADGRYVLTYNGEVYNFQELKKELESLGYRFKSASDTEVVLYSLIHWGVHALIRFNGMFSLGFWDTKDKKLILARDRYGIKPLYFSLENKYFAFGSEQKAITVIPGFIKAIDKAALLEYFTFQNIFTDKTLLQNISMLPAGHFGIFEPGKKNPNLKITKYWDYLFCEPRHKIEKEEYQEQLNFLLKHAINRQLVTDVEIGCYLSGGVDSGTITAIASKSIKNLKTFTCGFDLSSASGLELGFDERAKAEALSYLFKTEHYEMVLKAGDMERCLEDLAFHLEEPRIGQCYPNYYASKLVSKFVKVVLSGIGSDELFGGYPWRYYRASHNNNFQDYIDKYYLYWQRLVPNTTIKKLFQPIWSDVKNVWTRDIFSNIFINQNKNFSTVEEYINHSLYFEAKTFLHGLFVVEDKLSMAHSLETRVPFMDNDLVDFAMECPIHLKLRDIYNTTRLNENDQGNKVENFYMKTNDGKQILRDVMSRYVPASISSAVKQGFSSPDSSWFKGDSINFVKKYLYRDNAKIYEYLDRKVVLEILQNHIDGKENNRLFIWSLLNVEEILVQM